MIIEPTVGQRVRFISRELDNADWFDHCGTIEQIYTSTTVLVRFDNVIRWGTTYYCTLAELEDENTTPERRALVNTWLKRQTHAMKYL